MTLTCPSGATLTEAEAFLDAHPEIEAFDIVLHDSNGIGRGKIIRRHELAALYRSGRHMSSIPWTSARRAISAVARS